MKQKTNKEILALDDIFDQMDLTGIHIAFYPRTPKYRFWYKAHATFSKIDLMWDT